MTAAAIWSHDSFYYLLYFFFSSKRPMLYYDTDVFLFLKKKHFFIYLVFFGEEASVKLIRFFMRRTFINLQLTCPIVLARTLESLFFILISTRLRVFRENREKRNIQVHNSYNKYLGFFFSATNILEQTQSSSYSTCLKMCFLC